MRGPDGVDYPNHSVFIEIVYKAYLPTTHCLYRMAAIWKWSGSSLSMPSGTFEAKGDQTLLTMRGCFLTAKE